MSKYRIRILSFSNGKILYRPQVRKLFFWLNLSSKELDSRDEALSIINSIKENKSSIYEFFIKK